MTQELCGGPLASLGPIDPQLRAGPLPKHVGKKSDALQVLAQTRRGGWARSGHTDWVMGCRDRNAGAFHPIRCLRDTFPCPGKDLVEP